MRIRMMQKSDLDFAAESARLEGWKSETLEMFRNLLLFQPQGCFIAEVNGCQAGLCIGIRYKKSGFIGELIVRKEYRGRSIGPLLFSHTITFLEDHGIHSIFLDGVPKAVPFYESIGFQKVCRSFRFLVKPAAESSSFVIPMTKKNLKQVCDLDKVAFGADRGFFIRRRLSRYPHLCKVLIKEGKVTGYIQGHEAGDIVWAGPWVILDSENDSLSLLRALAVNTGKRKIRIGILETNSHAVSLIQNVSGVEQQKTAWRMCRGEMSSLGMSSSCYAIGSPAKG